MSGKWNKGNCQQCIRSNVLIDNNGFCFKCVSDNISLEMRKLIKEAKEGGISLKEIQQEWESTAKLQIEEMLRNAEQYQAGLGLTEQEKKEAKRMAEELIETIEVELYPNRKKNKSGSSWIWILVIGVIVIGGLIGFVWYRNKRNKH